MHTPLATADWLLDYEIKLSARYRRFVSFVLVRADKETESLDRILSKYTRSSDAVFREATGLAFVMGETGGPDAIEAIDRFKSVINGCLDVHYSLASYPMDGKTSVELRTVAHHRLDRARAAGPGAVVVDG